MATVFRTPVQSDLPQRACAQRSIPLKSARWVDRTRRSLHPIGVIVHGLAADNSRPSIATVLLRAADETAAPLFLMSVKQDRLSTSPFATSSTPRTLRCANIRTTD